MFQLLILFVFLLMCASFFKQLQVLLASSFCQKEVSPFFIPHSACPFSLLPLNTYLYLYLPFSLSLLPPCDFVGKHAVCKNQHLDSGISFCFSPVCTLWTQRVTQPGRVYFFVCLCLSSCLYSPHAPRSPGPTVRGRCPQLPPSGHGV